jgi:hypothetical protein
VAAAGRPGGHRILASAFGPHPDVAERARLECPNSVLRRLWWHAAHTANFAAVVYYPLPFYVGLLLLAAAAVLAVWPSRTMTMMMMRSESAPVGHATLVAARFRMERPRSVSKRIYLPLALAGPPGWGGGAGTTNLSPATMPRK